MRPSPMGYECDVLGRAKPLRVPGIPDIDCVLSWRINDNVLCPFFPNTTKTENRLAPLMCVIINLMLLSLEG